MAKKKSSSGHYCKICGEYKTNEKFSGRGCAAHICKQCSKLSAAEQSEVMTINRLMKLPMRRLNDSEKKWLENRVHDSRPEVAATAREIHNLIFPHAEHNERKQRLQINTLIFEVHSEVYDEYGDARIINQKFNINRTSGTLTMVDFDSDEKESSVILDSSGRTKLLRWVVHSLEIFAWVEEYHLQGTDEWIDLAVQEEHSRDDSESIAPVEPESKLYWRVQVEYCNGENQDILCNEDYLHDKVEELYLALSGYFEPDEDESDMDQEDEI